MKILYVHGLGDHPAKDTYKAQWDDALRRSAYFDDVATEMVYWVDVRHGVTDADSVAHARAIAAQMRGDRPVIAPRKTLLGRVQGYLLKLLDPMIRDATKELVDTVYQYFYGDIRAEILYRFNRTLDTFKPDVIIAHSWGTVIAYDYLVSMQPSPLETLITIGSPLGNDYIQSRLKTSLYPDCVKRWLNVFDDADPVTWPDRRIENDFCTASGAHRIRDASVPPIFDSSGKRYPHSWYGYLTSEPVQTELFKLATLLNDRRDV